MFHVVFSLTSRFLYLRNILRGFARGILALRSLDAISSHLTPALSPPPPVPLLDALVPFVERPEQIVLPYPSRDSSLIAVTPSQFPKFLPLLVILAVISGFVVILPEITYFFMNFANMPSAFTYASRYISKSFKSKPTFYCLPTSLPSQFASSKLPISLISLLLLWTGPPAIATFFTFVWFMSILFPYEQVSNMIVAILQWYGLLIVQDTQTPPLLDAIYEQITRGAVGYSDLVWCSDLSDENNKYQVITDYSLGYSHLAAQLSAHELDLQNPPMSRENEELEVSVQRVHTESIDSQDLHRRLELSRDREQKLDADLLASEQERERLIELVWTSRRNQQGWKEIASVAKELYVEGEMIASNLRVDLAAATDRVRNMQEQLDHQIEVASGKDSVIQSITKESRLAHTRLRLERERRVRETKELLHEKVTTRNRYESEMRRLTQEAQDAQDQLGALRDTLSQLRSDGQTPLDRDHPLGYHPLTTWPYDTGQPPLPPEWNLDTRTSPVSTAIDPCSSHQSAKWSPHSPIQDQDASTRLLEIQEELIATKEQLRLAEEEVHDLRLELGQSRVSFREVETHVRALEDELGICQATAREAQDAQYASEVKFTEATQLLRVHQAESESSMARAEESQLKCSQVTFLCVALQERVTELEAKVKKLKSAREYRAQSNSRSRRPAGTCTDLDAVANDQGIRESDSIYMTLPPSMPRLLDLPLPPSSPYNDSSLYLSNQECSTTPLASADSGSCRPTNTDPEANTHDTDEQTFNSIFLTTPPSLPRLPDLSLPPSSSQSSTSPLCFNRQMRSAIPTCTDSHLFSLEDMDLDATAPDANSRILDSSLVLSPQPSINLSHLLPLRQLEDSSLPSFLLSRTFLSERNSLGSVDWSPIGSSLLPEHGNARKDDNISLRSPTEEKGKDSILLCRKALLSPIEELDEVEVLERHTSHERDIFNDDRKSRGLSQRGHTPDAPPIWTLSSPRLPAPPTSKRRVDVPVTLEREDITRPSLVSMDHVSEPPHLASSSRIIDLPLPAFPRITLPRFSLSPSGIHERLEHRLAPSEPGNDRSDTEVGSSAPDPLLDVLSSAQNGEFHSTGDCCKASSFPQVDKMPRGGTQSTSPTKRRFSRRSQDVCLAVPKPAHQRRLNKINTAGPAGVLSISTSPNSFSLGPPVHPSISLVLDCQDVQRPSSSVLLLDVQPSLTTQLDSLPLSISAQVEDCGRPTAVIGSRHKGIDSEAGTSSSRTTLGSLPSPLRTSADQGSSMRARRRRRDPMSRSNNVTSTRSDLAPESFLSSSDNFLITTSRGSSLPLSQISNLPDVSLARKDAKTQAVKCIPKSMPRPPPSYLVPELLDQAFIQSDEAPPPCAPGKAPKGRCPNDYRISSRPRDTSSPDCFLPGDSVFNFGRAALEGLDHEFENFVFFIPPDCPTSTPVASQKGASRKCSTGSGAAASAVVAR